MSYHHHTGWRHTLKFQFLHDGVEAMLGFFGEVALRRRRRRRRKTRGDHQRHLLSSL